MTAPPTSYDEDLVRWSAEQAAALRAASSSGLNLPLDWENLAEEIASLGKSQRRELASRVTTVIEHLLKLEFSPATEPRDGWIGTVLRERDEIEGVLADNRSLRPSVPEMISGQGVAAADRVARTLEGRDRLTGAESAKIRARRYEAEEVLGQWLPTERPATR